jgi:signal transduction histidine kinase/CheY-like chemotaxis protein
VTSDPLGPSRDAFLNTLADPVDITDADGVLVFANASAAWRFDADKQIGLGLAERRERLRLLALDGTPLPAAEHPVARALATRRSVPAVRVLVEPEGRGRHAYAMTTVPLLAGSRLEVTLSIYALLAAAADPTEETRVRGELEVARAEAEEANRMKDQFIAALSHELRAPLQPILGWTEVLRRRGTLDDVTAHAVDAIRRNIRQQVRLVDDLLDLSRIVHRKLSLRYEHFDLRDHVRAAAEPFEEAAALKRVGFTMSLPREPLVMWGDGSRIQQIASNLISNAVKFTPPGGDVTVRLALEHGDGVLDVEDSGDGIAREDLAIIFDAFGQGGRAGRKGGLGIGLDLVRRLAELHGGQVTAHSEGLGHGARFTLRLPLVEGPAPSSPSPEPPQRRLDRRSILVIEDNVDTREVLKFMLELEGARVATAESGGEGVRAAQQMRPEIVLCDIGLPDIDGLEVARRLSGAAPEPRPRLIALTGYGQAEDVRDALDAGFQAHLTKPVNLDELLALIG